MNNPRLTSLEQEAPPRGGSWCLKLVAGWAPTTGSITAVVPEVRDGDTLRLSAHVRGLSPFGGGGIVLFVGKNNSVLPRHYKGAVTSDTAWTSLRLVDTLSLEEGESAWVSLSSLPTERQPRVGEFDLVVLERVRE